MTGIGRQTVAGLALNAALNAASSPYVCAVDADAILEPNSLKRVMAPMIKDPRQVIASGGIRKVSLIGHGAPLRWKRDAVALKVHEVFGAGD